MPRHAVSRDPQVLANTSFDLVVVGAGLFGAFAAWDATQRGLSVALIDRGDFGGATSANSFRIVHGGIRYIQHGDVYRLRQSSGERRALLRIAPHLVRPLPVVIPTHGRGMSGKAALGAGLRLYDALTWDRNRGIRDPARRLPGARMIGRDEVREMFPGLIPRETTGAGVFHDGQFYNPPRLVWAVVESAMQAGAVALNYIEATGLLRRGDRAEGIVARDVLGGGEFEIRGRMVLNAAGPYAETLLTRWGLSLPSAGTYSRDACFIVRRRLLPGRHALAILGQTRDPDARISRGARHFFIHPWRDYTLIGVWHRVQGPGSLDIGVTEEELSRFIAEVRQSAPGLDLSLHDVSMANAGLVPFGENADGAEDLRYGHRSTLVDHSPVHGCENLVTLIGLRLTTARFEAERAIDLVFRKRNVQPPPCRTSGTPVRGGGFQDWEGLLRQVESDARGRVPIEVAHSVASHYGAEYRAIFNETGENPFGVISSSATLRAQVYRAVRSEMAVTLADVVLRRTDLGTGLCPGRRTLTECAEIMATELGWTDNDVEQQIGNVANAHTLGRWRDDADPRREALRRTVGVESGW
jgi:glycerol-3-phosphate dehydrogenase